MKLHRTVALALASLVTLAGAPAVWAGGKPAAKAKPKNVVQERTGTVGFIDEKGVTLRDKKGKETKFVFTPMTKFVTAQPSANPTIAPTTYRYFQPGNHVKITFTKGEDGQLTVKQLAAAVSRAFGCSALTCWYPAFRRQGVQNRLKAGHQRLTSAKRKALPRSGTSRDAGLTTARRSGN